MKKGSEWWNEEIMKSVERKACDVKKDRKSEGSGGVLETEWGD